jgi:hypothetical protein
MKKFWLGAAIIAVVVVPMLGGDLLAILLLGKQATPFTVAGNLGYGFCVAKPVAEWLARKFM